jgi:putative two-component system response regulator
MTFSDNGFAGASILLIEDDPQAVGVLEPILISKGYSVTVARDGVEGLNKLRSTSPDLLLCDIDMPRMDGIEVCRAVKNDPATRLIPVVMLTGFGDLENKIEALQAGADEFLNKPYNSLELFTRLNSLLRMRYLNAQLDNAEDVLFSMARAIEAKDVYTQGHVERVSNFAMQLGAFMGLSDEEQDSLRKGGILHDIGKIGVPDHILNKNGPLSKEERDVIQLHPEQGARICGKLKSIRGAIPIIRHHHERMDGSGYPDKLLGEEIPLLARILTVVDIYDALTTTRSYRKGLAHETALEILWEETNKGWWDKEVVGEFTKMVSQKRPEAETRPSPSASLPS